MTNLIPSRWPRILVADALLSCLSLLAIGLPAAWGDVPSDREPGDPLVEQYFRQQTREIEREALAQINSRADWQANRHRLRDELLYMLGLDPLPSRSELHPVVTGNVKGPGFRVEKLYFQSRPGLYVTANLYLPSEISSPRPAILYGCGHARVAEGDVSYGNKVHYQHHGAWFARHGYVCLVIDTLQLGEIEAIHHGTYRYGLWWWLNRGYTPAGVEAWNCLRALDYLQSRPEVDSQRLGVTGRSGGGIYSWWIAAIDDRIQVAVPVAGITDMRNQVIDGCVEGHCDCMFHVNTFRWDFPTIAALVAPRPLLISNTDRDGIFPLDGVVRTHSAVRRIYRLLDAEEKVALHITAGPHQDTQELRVHAFRWFNQHLRDSEELIDEPATKHFTPSQLRVFHDRPLPKDQINTTIHETFVPTATPRVPTSDTEWSHQRDGWRRDLLAYTFRGWPEEGDDAELRRLGPTRDHDGVTIQVGDFRSQEPYRLPMVLLQPESVDSPTDVTLRVASEAEWARWASGLRHAAASLAERLAIDQEADPQAWQELRRDLDGTRRVVALFPPRGVGPTRWDASARKRVQHRRRFHLLGQTLDGMRVWDVRRAIQALRHFAPLARTPLEIEAQGSMAGVVVYATLFEPPVARLRLRALSHTHREGPFLLNVRRWMDLSQAVVMAVERQPVELLDAAGHDWSYVTDTAQALGTETFKQLSIVNPATQD